MDMLSEINMTLQNPYLYAEKWKESRRGSVIGYFCSYTPEEIIHAAGALPMRILGTRESISMADSHLQSYCCSLVRGGLEDAMRGSLRFLDGSVFPHTCDSIQRLSDIWRLNGKISHHFDLVLPVKLNTQSSMEYFTQVYQKFKNELAAALQVNITDEKLGESIRLYNDIRSMFMKLYQMRSSNPDLVSGNELHAIIMGSMIHDRLEFRNLLNGYLARLLEKKDSSPSKRKRIMLTGGICTHPDIYSCIEESGGVVAWDDLCTGRRFFEGQTELGEDLIQSIADRYIERINCPAKHSSPRRRGEEILRSVDEQRIDGVIFLILKFCDPHSFDYPYIKSMLDSRGVPTLLLEIEEKLPPEGQLRTRIETFIQVIEGG